MLLGENFYKKILSPMTNIILGGIVWERRNNLCVCNNKLVFFMVDFVLMHKFRV
jgi:hypothetical protein